MYIHIWPLVCGLENLILIKKVRKYKPIQSYLICKYTDMYIYSIWCVSMRLGAKSQIWPISNPDQKSLQIQPYAELPNMEI